MAVIVSTSTDRTQRLEPFFHVDAEALLFVDHEQPEILEADIGLRQPVRADHDVDRSVGQSLDDLPLFLGRAKTAEDADLERKLGHPATERAAMLFGQDGGRHQHGHLVAGVDRFERGPHRQFGLAVADVAADQPVERPQGAACRP